jgi:hypothetical protein
MIQDMVRNALTTLTRQWEQLAIAFHRMAADLDAVDPNVVKSLIGNPDPDADPADADPASAQGICLAAAVDVDAVAKTLPATVGAKAIFDKGRAAFEAARDHGLKDAQGQLAGFLAGHPGYDSLDPVAACVDGLTNLEEFITRCLSEFDEVTAPEGPPYNLHRIRGSVENIASYPILTSDVGEAGYAAPAPTPGWGANGGPATSSFQKRVDGAIKEVLGRLPKLSDTRSLTTALVQVFEATQIEGRVTYSWKPRSYVGQTELGGGVSGAQASLYSRARVTLDNALPILDGLYPLLPDADEEETDAIRGIITSQLKELVAEIGTEGGMRVSRVDGIFEMLLQGTTTDTEGKPVTGGQFGYLKHAFGLTEDQVNTLDEEQNVTNFLLLRDYVTGLESGYVDFRKQWFGRDLGTRLVLLSRALTVVAESVGEVVAAMDSVFVGAGERLVASFPTTDGYVVVDELLGWVRDFAATEAPRLIQTGGRRGVEALTPTIQRLDKLLGEFLAAITNDPALPAGLRHPRVRHPLDELRSYLRQVRRLAENVRRPLASV